jgi:hypothetical protein
MHADPERIAHQILRKKKQLEYAIGISRPLNIYTQSLMLWNGYKGRSKTPVSDPMDPLGKLEMIIQGRYALTLRGILKLNESGHHLEKMLNNLGQQKWLDESTNKNLGNHGGSSSRSWNCFDFLYNGCC